MAKDKRDRHPSQPPKPPSPPPRPPRPPQPPPPPGRVPEFQFPAAAAVAVESTVRANAYVIPALKTRHGPRPGGKRGWMASAILEYYQGNLPRGSVNILKLAREVAKILNANPEYTKSYGEMNPDNHDTVRRALADLRKANR
jgi:hypothetical protein